MFYHWAWCYLAATYLFFVGLGSGAIFVSCYNGLAISGLKNKSDGREIYRTIKMGAVIGNFFLLAGSLMAVLDLASISFGVEGFDVGGIFGPKEFSSPTFSKSFIFLGSWLLPIMMTLSLMYLFDVFGGPTAKKSNTFLNKSIMALSIALTVYTSYLLSDTLRNPHWNNSVLALLFLVSALSSGLAALMLGRILLFQDIEIKHRKILTLIDVIILAIETFLVFLFILTHYLFASSQDFSCFKFTDLLLDNILLVTAVVFGVVFPAFIKYKSIVGDRIISKTVEFVLVAMILFGAYLLRLAVIFIGQYS